MHLLDFRSKIIRSQYRYERKSLDILLCLGVRYLLQHQGVYEESLLLQRQRRDV
jgi:hypothetical protein